MPLPMMYAYVLSTNKTGCQTDEMRQQRGLQNDLRQLCKASPDLWDDQNVHRGLRTDVTESQRLQSSQSQGAGNLMNGWKNGRAITSQYEQKETVQGMSGEKPCSESETGNSFVPRRIRHNGAFLLVLGGRKNVPWLALTMSSS